MSVEAVQFKVQRVLTEMLGTVRIDSKGQILLELESAYGIVEVIDWGDGETVVKISSPLLREVPLTPQVFEWVATEGQNRYFAHARVYRDESKPFEGTIVWEHDLLGNSLDPEELKHAVSAVMVGANKQDDELQARFGGLKGFD